MPRMMTPVRPMAFVVEPTTTYILFEINMPRRIYTDGREFPKDEEPTLAGYSIGKWVDEDGDGQFDVLQVETVISKGRAPSKPAAFLCMRITNPWSGNGFSSTRQTETRFTT
jgi:hypothetical protein